MIYYMYAKNGPQYHPQFDYGRERFEGPIAHLDDPEVMKSTYIPENPDRPWLPLNARCERVPEHMFWRIPKQIFQLGSRPWKTLPDISQLAVTERFHDLIEKFDPGAHQFFPVAVIHKKSRRRYDKQGQFYLWNILTKACPHEVLDYPSLEAKGLLKITEHHSRPGLGRLYQIKYLGVNGFAKLVARRAGFKSHHIIRCTPCGSDTNIEDVHTYGLWPLVTEEFKSAALQLGVDTLDFHAIPTID